MFEYMECSKNAVSFTNWLREIIYQTRSPWLLDSDQNLVSFIYTVRSKVRPCFKKRDFIHLILEIKFWHKLKTY